MVQNNNKTKHGREARGSAWGPGWMSGAPKKQPPQPAT